MPSLRPDRWDEVSAKVESTSDATVYPLGEEYTSYSDAINRGWKKTTEPFLFLGADDLVFHPGWLDAALRMMDGDVRVVGTNDLHNPYVKRGHHSTHSLVDRRYIERVGGVIDDGPGVVLYPYTHQFTDCEFVETAQYRNVFAACLDAKVAHIHPDFGGRPADHVDKHTRRDWERDYRLFMSRRHLWGGGHLPYFPPERT